MTNTQSHHTYRWVGSETSRVNTPTLSTCRDIITGVYGGHTDSGAEKNNDGCFLLADTDNMWEFAVLLSANNTAQSALLILEFLTFVQPKLVDFMQEPASFAFPRIQSYLLEHLDSKDFRTQARHVYGESAVLLCARKGGFIWWLNIGMNSLYLLHPDFMDSGQFAVNQPVPFESIGRSNTFDAPIPGYASGVRPLRPGKNHLLMATNSFHRFANSPFTDPALVYTWFNDNDRPLAESIQIALLEAHKAQSQTPVTLVGWTVDTETP